MCCNYIHVYSFFSLPCTNQHSQSFLYLAPANTLYHSLPYTSTYTWSLGPPDRAIYFLLLIQCGESTKWRNLFLFLAPHKVSFLEYLYSYQKEFVQIKRRVRGKNLENIRMFLLSIWDTGIMCMNFDEKKILRMFSRIRPDCRIALTSPERAWISAYSALYLNKFHHI